MSRASRAACLRNSDSLLDMKDELYSEQDIVKKIEELSKSPEEEPPPAVPGANTLSARLILSRIREALFDAAEKNIQDLI